MAKEKVEQTIEEKINELRQKLDSLTSLVQSLINKKQDVSKEEDILDIDIDEEGNVLNIDDEEDILDIDDEEKGYEVPPAPPLPKPEPNDQRNLVK